VFGAFSQTPFFYKNNSFSFNIQNKTPRPEVCQYPGILHV